MSRHVKGSLFSDYVRMIRSRKDLDWGKHLLPEDLAHVLARIDVDQWYPMEVFERMGNAILAEIANGDLGMVRLWGRFSADPLHELHPTLVAKGDAVETLMRFKVLRSTFFDFEALEIPMLLSNEAHVIVRYYMGATAEEAASFQTMGFCEGLLALAGVEDVSAEFQTRSWAGDAATKLLLKWK